MPEIRPRSAAYHVPVRADFEPLVESASAEVRRVFEEHVYPHFPRV